MNSNSKLKIVWMVCGVAIVLLFCTQAYWLHLQCQYSLDQQVEQFKKNCDEVLAQDLKNRKKLQENSSMKGRRDTATSLFHIIFRFYLKHNRISSTFRR